MSESLTYNIRDDLKQNTVAENQEIQKENSIPHAVCCLNISGDLNVGSIIRTACIFGFEKMFIFGRRRYDRRSSVGSQNYIELERYFGLDDQENYDVDLFYKVMDDAGYLPIFLEQGGIPLRSFRLSNYKGKKLCLVFGNEGDGIPDYLMKDSPRVEIEQTGVMRSLNVSNAAGIFMYNVISQL